MNVTMSEKILTAVAKWKAVGDLGDGLPKQQEFHPGLTESSSADTCSKIKLKLQDIQDAHNRIKDSITVTPLIEAKYVGKNFCKVYLKCENLQTTGSFKARGASNVLSSLSPSEKSKGCTVSGGRNFLYAMTHYGLQQSVPINVVVPKDCPLADKQRYKENLALIKLHGNDRNEATLHAIKLSETLGTQHFHGSDRLDLLAGYGTLGLEILNQLDKLDAIICPVGCGALVASIIVAVKTLKPNCLIYGVESIEAPTMTRALQEKKPVMVQMSHTAADSLSSVIAGTNAYHIIRRYLDRMITLDETWVSRAMLALLEREKLVAEGAAACALAALLAGKAPELRAKNVVCVVSGGNTGAAAAGAASRGLAGEGRRVRVRAALPAPAALARLLARLADAGACLRSVAPEPRWMCRDDSTFSVNLLIETSDMAHAKELERKLLKEYPQSQFMFM